MKTEKPRILAIDYGARRIGIAITDPLRLFSIPLLTIPNDKDLWSNLLHIFDSYEIETVVIGYPLKESGGRSSSTEMVEKFRKELEKKISQKILFVDERYSSEIAQQRILETVPSKKKRKDKNLIDKNAAAVILQSYLDGA
ncbi:MAG: Holliday junction resolvase RuvX [Melioribacteraceae bacterium]|nr:Holliday junction resolvase RuvX [Melioribacteraceae bacterium]MDD3557827.1 Holliday junction resolvase RuvX [Melioribacteraceae bacterium]